MAAPSELPRWATAGGAQITHPSTGFQDLGYEPNTPAGAGVRNWLDNLVYKWIDWLNDQDEANTNAHEDFDESIISLQSIVAGQQEVNALLNPKAMVDVDGGSTNEVYGACVLPGSNSNNSDMGIVVVGLGGEIHTSLDNGATWTARTSGVATALLDVIVGVAGSDLLIAVGQLGKILTGNASGTTWTSRTSGTTQNLNAIANSGSNTYMAVGSAGTVLTSSNGTTWTAATSINGGVFEATQVLYMNGRWIVCGSVSPVDPDKCLYFSDNNGSTWTAVKNSGSSALWGATGVTGDNTAVQIAQANGVLVAMIRDDSNFLARAIISFDRGNTWEVPSGSANSPNNGDQVLVAGTSMFAIVPTDPHKGGVASFDCGATWNRQFYPGFGTVGRIKRLTYNSDEGHGTCQFIGLGANGSPDDRGKVALSVFFTA